MKKDIQALKNQRLSERSSTHLRSLETQVSTYEEWTFLPFSMLLMGSAGLGKTYYMYLLIKNLVTEKRTQDFRFFKMTELEERLLAQFNEFKSSKDLVTSCSEAPYLFLDDLATERTSERAVRDLFEIIDYRVADERVTVISTNLNESQIKNDYGLRIASRLQTFSPIVFMGEDRRRRKILK